MSTISSHIDEAQAIVRDALVWDNVWPVDLKGLESYDNGWDKLDRFADAGVNVLGVTLAGDNHNITEAIDLIAWARAKILAHPDKYILAESVNDIINAENENKLAIYFQFEGMRCFERNLDMIGAYRKLGIMQTILAFNNSNSIGGGCAEEYDGGLTNLGRTFVDKLQAGGIFIDLSHVGRRTSLQAMERATKPTAFTHSTADAIRPCFRNVTDEQIKAVAETGGLVGVSGSSEYLGDQACTSETLFKHIDHTVQLVGPTHAGIGLDVVFNPAPLSAWARTRPEEWPMTLDPNWPGFNYAKPEQIVDLTALMLSAGYSTVDVKNILGENYIRVFKQATEIN
mgnify:CR=1 FL=1